MFVHTSATAVATVTLSESRKTKIIEQEQKIIRYVSMIEKSRKEIERLKSARLNSKPSAFTKHEVATIVKEVVEIMDRDKVSLGRALNRYNAAHLDDPRTDQLTENKVGGWTRKIGASSPKGAESVTASQERGEFEEEAE